jgi:hypothetical protein
MAARQAAYLWETYMLAAIRDTAGSPRILVSYEEMLRHPAAETRRLAAFCGLAIEDATRIAERVIDPELRHASGGIETVLRSDVLTAGQRLLYLAARAVERGDVEHSSATIEALDGLYRRLHDESALARADAALANRERQVELLQQAAYQHELAQQRRDEHVSKLLDHNHSLLQEIRSLGTALQSKREEAADLTAARNFLAGEVARLRREHASSADEPD